MRIRSIQNNVFLHKHNGTYWVLRKEKKGTEGRTGTLHGQGVAWRVYQCPLACACIGHKSVIAAPTDVPLAKKYCLLRGVTACVGAMRGKWENKPVTENVHADVTSLEPAITPRKHALVHAVCQQLHASSTWRPRQGNCDAFGSGILIPTCTQWEAAMASMRRLCLCSFPDMACDVQK